MQRFVFRFGPGVLAALLLGGLAVYLLANTRLDTSNSVQTEQLEIKTEFPNARCNKTVSQTFPFVTLECNPQNSPATRTPDSSPDENAGDTVSP